MALFKRKTVLPDESEVLRLAEEADSLESELNHLEEFVTQAPEIAKKQFEERYSTMPPPDELEDRRRERLFHAKLCRNELRNERRYQAQSGFMIVLLVACAISLAAWAIKISQFGL